MLSPLPGKPLFKVNPVTGLDVPYNIKPEPLGMVVTLLEISIPGTVIGQDSKQILVKHGSVYVRLHACRITHTIDTDDNNGSNNIGDTAENAPNLSLSDSKNINQSNHFVTDNDDADREDNLESDVLSNLETVHQDEENPDDTNNENEHNNQANTCR